MARMRVSCWMVVGLFAACDSGSETPDSGPTGARVRFGWTIISDPSGLFIPCEAIGASQLRVDYAADGSDADVFSCAEGHGVAVTRELPLGDFNAWASIADGSGNVLFMSEPFNEVGLLTVAGQVVDLPPLVFSWFNEPEPQLRAIAEGAKAFFPQPPAPDSQFPSRPMITPPLGACCAQPGQTCFPSPADLWTGSWQDLSFVVTARGRWMYDFEPSGIGLTASFDAVAYADLDCDAVYSKYVLHGAVDATGTVVIDEEIQKIVDHE